MYLCIMCTVHVYMEPVRVHHRRRHPVSSDLCTSYTAAGSSPRYFSKNFLLSGFSYLLLRSSITNLTRRTESVVYSYLPPSERHSTRSRSTFSFSALFFFIFFKCLFFFLFFFYFFFIIILSFSHSNPRTRRIRFSFFVFFRRCFHYIPSTSRPVSFHSLAVSPRQFLAHRSLLHRLRFLSRARSRSPSFPAGLYVYRVDRRTVTRTSCSTLRRWIRILRGPFFLLVCSRVPGYSRGCYCGEALFIDSLHLPRPPPPSRRAWKTGTRDFTLPEWNFN